MTVHRIAVTASVERYVHTKHHRYVGDVTLQGAHANLLIPVTVLHLPVNIVEQLLLGNLSRSLELV